MDAGKQQQVVPKGRKSWLLLLVVLGLVAAAVALVHRGSPTAAITYVLS